jgi:prepilin-type N-terminal cleavage/methylation domain-containing protein
MGASDIANVLTFSPSHLLTLLPSAQAFQQGAQPRMHMKTIQSREVPGEKGYTLIEITVVVVLIGVILLMAVPRVQDTLTNDRMRSAVRNLSGTARDLKASAVREQVDHYLHLDLEQRRVWNTRDDMTADNRTQRRNQARSLPSGVRIADVALADEGKKNQGEVIIRFFSQGYVQPAAIHLTDDEHTMTLIFQPFLSTFEVQDKYVDVWQKSK